MSRKLTEIQDGEALDVLADLLDYVVEISSDEVFGEMMKSKDCTRLELVQYAIKNHKKSVMGILATLEGVPVEEYHCNVVTLPVMLLELVNDPEVLKLFPSRDQMTDQPSSGPAMEGTTEQEQ